MYTQCPQCATVFRINAGQLAQARGQVRCGVCEHGFNALESLSERPERYTQAAAGMTSSIDAHESTSMVAIADTDRSTQPTTDHRSGQETPAISSSTAATTSGPSLYERLADFIVQTNGTESASPSAVHSAAPLQTTPTDDTEPLPPAAQAAPGLREIKPISAGEHGRATYAPWVPLDPLVETARREPTVSPLDPDLLRDENTGLTPVSIEPRPSAVMPAASETGGGWKIAAWALANIALIAVLLGQYAYFNREELTQYPDLRPWLTPFCDVLGCDVPLLKDPSRISLANRVVQSHPGHEHALLIDATLVNEAAFTQAYPELELRFSDLDNQLVAGRRFRPAEYLPPGTDIPKGMTPRQPVRFSLEIADPGKQAVSFQFNLL